MWQLCMRNLLYLLILFLSVKRWLDLVWYVDGKLCSEFWAPYCLWFSTCWRSAWWHKSSRTVLQNFWSKVYYWWTGTDWIGTAYCHLLSHVGPGVVRSSPFHFKAFHYFTVWPKLGLVFMFILCYIVFTLYVYWCMLGFVVWHLISSER